MFSEEMSTNIINIYITYLLGRPITFPNKCESGSPQPSCFLQPSNCNPAQRNPLGISAAMPSRAPPAPGPLSCSVWNEPVICTETKRLHSQIAPNPFSSTQTNKQTGYCSNLMFSVLSCLVAQGQGVGSIDAG